MEFSSPAMCKGVNGDAPAFLIVALMLALVALLSMIPSLQGVYPSNSGLVVTEQLNVGCS